jgi:transcription antitermination factor NusG
MGKRGVRLLFPRYIFVGWSDEWRRLYSISGLKHPLMDVDKPAKVQDNVIEAFRSQQKDGIIRLPRREERFKRNTRLGVTRGPFENQIGLYLGMTDQDREIVLFNIIGRKVPVEFADPDVLYPILKREVFASAVGLVSQCFVGKSTRRWIRRKSTNGG